MRAMAEGQPQARIPTREQTTRTPTLRIPRALALPFVGMVAIACGAIPATAERPIAPDGAPPAQAAELLTQTPAVSDVTEIAVAPTAAPAPEPTAAPEKPPLPPQAEQILGEIATLPSLPTPAHSEAVRRSFEQDWASADTERKRYNAYLNIYSSLRSGYNPAKDHDRRAEMKKIQEFVASVPEWRRFYEASLEAGAFLDRV